MTTTDPKDKGASGNNSPDGTNLPTPNSTAPKLELKDGAVLVDGKKHVPEHELIAAKKSLRGDLESAETAHLSEIEKIKTELSAAQTEIAKANAALETARKAQGTGAISAEEMAKVKAEADSAKSALTAASTTGLDYRRKYLMAVYNIPADSDVGKGLGQKTSSQLDSFEEALKALVGNKGAGPGGYAFGGGSGSAAPQSPMDRAKSVLAATPIRGVRNEPK